MKTSIKESDSDCGGSWMALDEALHIRTGILYLWGGYGTSSGLLCVCGSWHNPRQMALLSGNLQVFPPGIHYGSSIIHILGAVQ